MRILVNYDPQLERHKPTLAGLLQYKGLTAVSTKQTLEIGTLLETAKRAQCVGVLVANEQTLRNLVNNESGRQITLDKYRGSRLDFSIPVIVGAPLDHLRSVRHGRWLYEKDLEKFNKIKQKVTQLQFTVCKDIELLGKATHVAEKALVISIDIETDSQNRITCCGFSCLMPNFKTITFIIPFIDFGIDHWQNVTHYGMAINALRYICKLSNSKLFFNGLYDAQMLITYHAEPLNFTLDAMALAHAEFAELPKTLDFVCSYQLYDYYFWKDEADESRKKGDIQSYWAYCARDAWNTLRCFCIQIQTAQAYTYKNYQMLFKMVYPYMYGAFEGCLLDAAKLSENKQTAHSIAEAAKLDLQTMAASKEFNPGSSKQVGELLFDILGAQPIRSKEIIRKKKDGSVTKTVNRSTDEKTLNKIAEQHPIIRIFIERLFEYREKVKAISTYFEFAQWKGRLLYSINPFGTDTGRGASRASSFRLYDITEQKEADRIKSYGTQIQNIPLYAKNMLIADEGFELFEADNNKSEARCVGYLSKCKELIRLLEDAAKDFYLSLGTLFFGIPYEQVSKQLRNDVIKRIVHGRNYLMGADTFIENAGTKRLYEGAKLLDYAITTLKEFANYLLNKYNKPFPEINVWYNEVKLEVLRTHTLVSPLGYTRYFFGDVIKDHKVFRNAVAHAPQNLSVCVINKGVWRVYTELVLTGCGQIRLKAQIHDSIFGQWKLDKAEYYKPLVLECMNNPTIVHNKLMSIPVDIKTGYTWAELKS